MIRIIYIFTVSTSFNSCLIVIYRDFWYDNIILSIFPGYS